MTFTTHNNHYKIGYDGVNNFQLRETNDQKHTVEFGRATRIGTFKEEAIKTARQIYEDANGQTIYISLSGGVDSEFIVHAFMAAGVPFECITARFNDNINEYDMGYVKKLHDKYKFKLNILDIDIIKFLETRMMEYADATNCCTPQNPLHMHLWDSFDGFVVAGHELVFNRKIHRPQFETMEKEDSVHKYFVWRNRNGAPAFYFYTPELVLSFIMDPIMTKLFAFGKAFQVGYSGPQKTLTYESCFDIEKREMVTGFERIIDIDRIYRTELERKYLFPPNHRFVMPLADLIQTLCPKEYLEKRIIP